MKRVLDPLNPNEGLLMVTKDEWDELKGLRVQQRTLKALAEARLVALQQYAGHHSSCVDCYRVWEQVEHILTHKAGSK